MVLCSEWVCALEWAHELVAKSKCELRLLRKYCLFLNRPDDLRHEFGRYGDVRDVYIPKDFYTKFDLSYTIFFRLSNSFIAFCIREPKGFAFIEFSDNRDAEDAQHGLDRKLIDGREVTVVFAQENRKAPRDMRAREEYAILNVLIASTFFYILSSADPTGVPGHDRTRPVARLRAGCVLLPVPRRCKRK